MTQCNAVMSAAADDISDHLDEELYGTDPQNLCQKLRQQESFRVIVTDKQRLPNLYKNYLSDKQHYVFLCQSPMNSGKTFQLDKIIKNFRRSAFKTRSEFRALVITPKRTFASYMVKHLQGFQDYRKCSKPFSYVNQPRFVVQVQSLKHFEDIDTDSYSVRGYSLLIMDEVHSIFEELFSDLFTLEEKLACINIFIKILRAIPKWLCFDAHISVDMVKILAAIDADSCIVKSHICVINRFRRPDYKLVFFRKCGYSNLVIAMLRRKLCASNSEFGKYKSLLCNQKIQTIVTTKGDQVQKLFRRIYIRDYLTRNDTDDIVVALSDSLRRGERVCATTSTRRQAEMLADLFKKCGFKVLLITGDSSEEIKKEFALDPDRFVCRCQLFIYTTAFQVGINVSAAAPYFHVQYIFLDCSTQTASPGAIVQTVGRIRNLKNRQYVVSVLNVKKRRAFEPRLTMEDMLPMKRELVLPNRKKNKKVIDQLVDFYFKEKSLSKHIVLFVNMFVRLMSKKARSYAMINNKMCRIEDVVNFAGGFHYSHEHYDSMANSFLVSYQEEICKHLDHYARRIWQKLESSSIYVSTLINNYDAFLTLPNGMTRSECLLKVCEFTTYPFGLMWSYVLSANRADASYFDRQLHLFYPRCSMTDLLLLKTLFGMLASCCTRNSTGSWPLRSLEYAAFLNTARSDIVFLYSRFVSQFVCETASVGDLFTKLMFRTLHIHIRKDHIDLTELHDIMKIINIDKWVSYNAAVTSGASIGGR